MFSPLTSDENTAHPRDEHHTAGPNSQYVPVSH